MKSMLILCAAVLASLNAFGAIQSKTIEYKVGDQVFEGFLAYDDAVAGPRPGVLIVEMAEAEVGYKFVAYPGAVHSFTHWTAGDDNSKGAAYNKEADEKSWEAMKAFFTGIFSK